MDKLYTQKCTNYMHVFQSFHLVCVVSNRKCLNVDWYFFKPQGGSTEPLLSQLLFIHMHSTSMHTYAHTHSPL